METFQGGKTQRSMKKKISTIFGVGVTLALLASLLVGVLPASALGVPVASIKAGENIISRVDPDYTVRFDVDQELDNLDYITITFPSDTVITPGSIAATITATAGWVGGVPDTPATLATLTWSGSSTSRYIRVALGAGDHIGEGAEVRIVITAGITNPTSPADYQLTVSTSVETTAQTSNTYAIVPPSLYYPGNIEIRNPGGYLMGVETSLNTAMTYCTTPGYTLTVSTGYYDENVAVGQQVTIVAAEGATPVIADLPQDTVGTPSGSMTVNAGGNKTSTGSGVILDGLTFMGDTESANVLIIQAEGATVQNCIFTKAGSSVTTPVQTMLAYSTAPALYRSTISNCSFDMTLGARADVGINVTGNGLTVSGCTFVGDYDAAYTQDYYIQNSGGTLTMPIVSTGNTATGASGTFIYTPTASTGRITSTGDSMTGMWRALRIYGGTVIVTDATISSSGVSAVLLPPLGVPAIDIAGGTTVFTMTNSTVSGSMAYAFNLGSTVDWDLINVMFNSITGNTKNVYSAAAAAGGGTAPLGANFEKNYWGDMEGPATGSMGYATSATTNPIDYSHYLGAPATGAFVVPTTGTYSFVTQGVSFTVTAAATGLAVVPGMLGAANYSSNPAGVDPSQPVIEDGYYDVFIAPGAGSAPTDVALVVISNPNIDETTMIYVLDELNGVWGPADIQGTNVYGHTVWFQTGLAIWPPIGGLNGTPVALVTAPLAAPAQSSLVPAQAATGVIISPTSLSWGAITGAEGYDFQLSEYPFSPTDLLVDETTDTNGIALVEELDYLTVYAWRVRAYRGTEYGPWVTSFFTTAEEVPEEVSDTWVIQQEPTQIEWPEDITVVVPPIETTEIPEYILWVVVAVGAILVIAVVVLIVRTRRVA
jgi:hypothetical protein